ncbi:Uncharacterised protein [Mycobacteroides abscessus subsp. massiliense]|nr:Uncharacterised protein [Mycobacteroides abscessus subsp. massiliense]
MKKLAKVNRQKKSPKILWMKSLNMVAKKSNQVIKMNLIQTHRKVVKKTFQVNQALKTLILAKLLHHQ